MLRKTLAVIVMIGSILGAIFCAAGILGVWAVQAPVKNEVGIIVDTANGYVGLVNQALKDGSERIAGVRTEIEDAQQRLQSLTPAQREAIRQQIREAAAKRFGPSVIAARNTVQQVSTSLNTLNQTLESINRIPGVHAPTLTDQLAAVNQRMDAWNSRLQDYQTALSDTEFNGKRLDATATQVTTEIRGVEDQLSEWQGQLSNVSSRLENAKVSIGNALTISAIGVTLFFALFLAGQISLFAHALTWFRKQKAI